MSRFPDAPPIGHLADGQQGATHGNGRDVFNPVGANMRSVWTIPTAGYRGAHFAVFPERLVEICIEAGCPPGGSVLDPFVGSGTTGVVAERMGRDFYGIELNPEFAQQARERIVNARAARENGETAADPSKTTANTKSDRIDNLKQSIENQEQEGTM